MTFLKTPFELKPKQQEAYKLARSKARFILFRGGSRSGKSFAICYFIFMRALNVPKSRHGIFRQTAVDVRQTLFDLTFKDMMEGHTPGLWGELVRTKKINDTEMTITLPNGSIIMFNGLDDATRQDRILGNEYSTVFVNEVSQFKSFDIIQKLISRLSEAKPDLKGKIKPTKLFLDCNPTTKRHWSYKAFIEMVNPISGEPWARQHQWAEIQMNPIDNLGNIQASYIDDLQNLAARDRQRFLTGEWQSDNDNAMFKLEWWNGDGKHKRRKLRDPSEVDDLVRIIVAIDPAGSSKAGADETGIIVAGKDEDGHIYILEDSSGRYRPDEWARKAIDAYERWSADAIITEDNFGKEMVPNTIRMLNPSVPVKCVTAMRGKVLRADPVATLYELGMVSHCGSFEKLEGQMEDFHIDWNRNKDGSPDRLDALVWAVTDLGVKQTQKRGGGAVTTHGFWG